MTNGRGTTRRRGGPGEKVTTFHRERRRSRHRHGGGRRSLGLEKVIQKNVQFHIAQARTKKLRKGSQPVQAQDMSCDRNKQGRTKKKSPRKRHGHCRGHQVEKERKPKKNEPLLSPSTLERGGDSPILGELGCFGGPACRGNLRTCMASFFKNCLHTVRVWGGYIRKLHGSTSSTTDQPCIHRHTRSPLVRGYRAAMSAGDSRARTPYCFCSLSRVSALRGHPKQLVCGTVYERRQGMRTTQELELALSSAQAAKISIEGERQCPFSIV